MTRLPRSVTLRVLLRSLMVQGSWNYETLIGTGFAFTILPVLRYIYPEDTAAFRAALSRHTEVFNSHPYLATVAVGAVARLESEGADPIIIQRFKSALRGSLGSIGDQLVWTAWKPATVMIGLVLAVAGMAWGLVLAAFLVTYNILHFGIRIWGLKIGISCGLEVGRILRDAPIQKIARRSGDVGALCGGFGVAVATADLLQDSHWNPIAIVSAAAAIVAGAWLGPRARLLFGTVLTTAWLLAIVFEWIR
ncbi:MAG TPA: PTS system mannose/fructose/sorbose family transporter subunit IID [Longimicrobiaceae bacterium]